MDSLESMDGNIFNIPMKIVTRLTHHFSSLFNFIFNIPDLIKEKLRDNENAFEKDEFGFKKLLIGITKTHNTLLALQSNNGDLVWSLHLGKIISNIGLLASPKDKVAFSSFHLLEKGESTEIVVVLSTEAGNSAVVVLDNDKLVQRHHDQQRSRGDGLSCRET